MRTLKFPLVGSYNNRSFVTPAGKDQFCKGALIQRIVNKASQTATWYVEKRQGLVNDAFPPSAGRAATMAYYSPGTRHVYIIFANAGGGADLWDYNPSSPSASVNCGTLAASGGTPYVIFSECIISGITYILLTTSSWPASATGSFGWYLASDSVSTVAYTADGNNSTTITDLKVAGVASVAGLYIGQKLTAASNVVAGSRIVSINAGAFSAVLDTATTGGAFNDLAITKEPVAKMNDADFPSDIVGGFAELDGYINIMTNTGRVYQSDINTVSSWGAANYLTCSKFSDPGIGVARYKNWIVAFSSASIEFLYNAGNASGSTMTSSDNTIGSKSIPPTHGVNVTEANGNLYWQGADSNIYAMEGTSPKKISSAGAFPMVTVPGSLTSFYLNKKQYLNLCYLISLSYRNIWYSVDDDTWQDPNFGNIASAAAMPAAGDIGNVFFVLGNSVGAVYRMSDGAGSYLDNGAAFTESIQIATDMGTNKRKFVSELRFEADVQSSGAWSVSYSDDDGVTYSAVQTVSLTSTRMRLTGTLGSFEGTRLWKFEDAGNNANRTKEIEIDFEVAA